MVSYISQNWRGRPLVSIETIIHSIGSTTTKAGRQIQTAVDTATYAKGINFTDEEVATPDIRKNDFLGEQNDTIGPVKLDLVIS